MVKKAIIVDNNIILDIFLEQEPWFSWSASRIIEYNQDYELLINKIIFAEVSSSFNTIQDVEVALKGFSKLDISYDMAFLAAKAFKGYRKETKEERKAILPDFFIGAQASILDIPLLTRDKRYKTYFPDLQLITPDQCP